VLIAENLADITPRISRNPYVANIEISLPTEDERHEFVKWKLEGQKLQTVSDVSFQALAKITAGDDCDSSRAIIGRLPGSRSRCLRAPCRR
jgi:AAA+ superfamily predicted ATPase